MKKYVDIICDNIWMAFEKILYPGDNNISQSDYGLEHEGLKDFVGKRNKDINIEFLLNGHKSSLSWMTPQAFCYFLPAYMSISCKYFNEADTIPVDLIRKLTYPILEDVCSLREDMVASENELPELKGVFDKNIIDDDAVKSKQSYFLQVVKYLNEKQKHSVKEFLFFMKSTYSENIDNLAESALKRFWDKLQLESRGK